MLWFQNIELAALNTFAITSRDISTSNSYGDEERFIDPNTGSGLYNTPPLVEYKKEGDWLYYREYSANYKRDTNKLEVREQFIKDFEHYWQDLYAFVYEAEDLDLKQGYDSVKVVYSDNYADRFYGFGNDLYTHVELTYHEVRHFPYYANFIPQRDWWNPPNYGLSNAEKETYKVVMSLGQYNENKERIGVWKHYDSDHSLYKMETYMKPWSDDTSTKVAAR